MKLVLVVPPLRSVIIGSSNYQIVNGDLRQGAIIKNGSGALLTR
jgi:hypothetical protein